MAFYSVNKNTVVIVNPKAGSMSMLTSLRQVPHEEVTAEQALTYENRVMFLRHPIERLNSLFNMFYRLTLNSSTYSEFMPEGTIRAYGARAKSIVGANDHHWKGSRKALCTDALAFERLEGLSDDEIELKLNNRDYRRFVNYILAGNHDSHWANQTDLSTHNDVLIPNIVHKFEDIDTYWRDYVSSPITHENSWPDVDHIKYKLLELRSYYANDIALWSTL